MIINSQEATYATDDNIFIVLRIFFILLTATLHSKDILRNLLLLYELLTHPWKVSLLIACPCGYKNHLI